MTAQHPTSAARVIIGVLTFRRPRDLAAVLPMLVRQTTDVRTLGYDVEVLVVDNDADASARDLVRPWESEAVR